MHQVELYGYPGNPFPGTNPATPLNVAGLLALRQAGDERGIRFPGRHGNLTEANWDNQITASKIVGQDHIGEAGLPGGAGAYNSFAGAMNTVALLNRLGKRSVEAGLGPAYFHNHQQEFNARFVDNGVLKSGWEFIMERTDPRYVSAQIDIGWAVCGLAYTTAPTPTPATGDGGRDAADQQVPEPDRQLPRQGHRQRSARRAATTTSARSAWARSTSPRCSPPPPTAAATT